MIKLLTVIGARPQIIKAAAFSRAIHKYFADKVEEKILHTGQHYDANMSDVFFGELGIPAPHFNLNVGSGRHGEQSAKMISGIEQVLLNEHFDGIVLYGDTNSTLAGAVAASKVHIPIFHIEAGLRSFNMSMPEEVNRIVCDQLSSILFAPTQTAVENLKREGFNTERQNDDKNNDDNNKDYDNKSDKEKFKNGKGREVSLSGDVMYDNSIYFASVADEKSTILSSLRLEKNGYILSTIHRDNNTDSKERLSAIFRALLDISEQHKIKVLLPLHPRTSKLLKNNLEQDVYSRLGNSDIQLISPVSFLDMIALEKSAKIIMTDSGGVQKEAFFFEKPTIILRPETEWVEIVNEKAGIIVDASYEKIVAAYEEFSTKEVKFPKLFGDGEAAKHIIERIIEYLQ